MAFQDFTKAQYNAKSLTNTLEEILIYIIIFMKITLSNELDLL